jgi:deoxyadenosine/deoxycytidine kinase
MSKLIAVTGSIAAGATTLAQKLEELMSLRRQLEENVENSNSFFKSYHEDQPRWAFSNQVMFLTKSAENHKSMCEDTTDTVYIQDFTPFEHTEVYATAQHRMGLLTDAEYTLLQRLTKVIEPRYKVPDVLIYRQRSKGSLRQRIVERGRPSEQRLDEPFLDAVWTRFEEWSAQWNRSPIITVDESVDVLKNEVYLQRLVGELRMHLNA